MEIDRRWMLSRRALLGGLTVAGVSPFFRGWKAFAQERPPSRFIVVTVPEGMWSGAERPVAGGPTLGPLFTALEPYRSRIHSVNNLDITSLYEGMGAPGHLSCTIEMLTGIEAPDGTRSGGPSIDQVIANAIGQDTPYRSLQFANRLVYRGAWPFWSAAGRHLPGIEDPWVAYDRVFGNLMPETPERPRVDLRRRALARAAREIAPLRSRLSAEDRLRLDSYHDSIESVEATLESLETRRDQICTPPVLGARVDPALEANYVTVGRLHTDLLVASLQCGLTRVASLQWGNSNDQCSYSWLGINHLGHDLAHNNGNCDPGGAHKTRVRQWYSEQFAYLLQKLSSVPEGEGTMLDNTVILWASEFGNCNGHSGQNLLWLLMGNVAGYFRPGLNHGLGGRSVNDFHVTLLNAFGVRTRTFGNPNYCTGPIEALIA